MALASAQYGLFLAAVAALALVVPQRFAKYLLAAASLLFYASGRSADLLIFGAVIAVSFHAGQAIEKNRSRKQLWLFLLPTVAPLLLLKYWHILPMPLGISFFTLQAVAYIVDVYRGRIEAETSPLDYALFLSFFPLVLSGPIERVTHLMPQIKKPGAPALVKGLFLIAKGVVIKCVFADNFAVFVNDVYARIATETASNAVLACYLYAFQIYCDFYGYTLIALGSAAMLGVELVNNFEHPYLASNIQDFWSRWHISLTNWLRDYIYFSLGGLRKSVNRYRNLMITWVVTGLWHGAGTTFLVWGAMHGAALSIYHLFRSSRGSAKSSNPIMRGLGWLVTFHFVVLAWVPFRADSWTQARMVFRLLGQGLTTGSLVSPSHGYLTLVLRLAVIFVVFEVFDWLLGMERIFLRSPAVVQAVWLALWCSTIYLAPMTNFQFIYARF